MEPDAPLQMTGAVAGGSPLANGRQHMHHAKSNSHGYRRGFLLPHEVYKQVAKEGKQIFISVSKLYVSTGAKHGAPRGYNAF
jgi:hypothetical protein